MIKILLSTLICLVLLSLSSCGESKDSIAYNNSIISIINENEKRVTEMNNAMNAADYAKAEEVRKLWEESINLDIKKVKDLGDFKGDTIFQRAVLDGLKGYRKIVTDDYSKLISVRKDAKADNAELEVVLLENINQAFENMATSVNQASDQFEKNYNKSSNR